jgi:hypothetical protein
VQLLHRQRQDAGSGPRAAAAHQRLLKVHACRLEGCRKLAWLLEPA